MRIRIGKGKRVLSLLLAAALFFGLLCPLTPQAAAETLDLPVPAAVLMEFSTGKVLYEKSAHEKRPCASITKVMTLLLVFEAIDSGVLHYDDVLTASAHAAGMGGSDIWLKEGEQMTVDDLIKACVVMSANDAAVVLAEAVAGTEESFVARMNARAAELGMADTTFKNCNGLDEDGHLTSAYDVAVMSRALMEHEKIFDYTLIWIDYVRGGQTQLVNTNKLVRSYNGIKGLKTGTTSAAGSCISAAAERNGMTLIGVVLGAENTKDRFSAASSLLDYGFANWKITVPEAPALPDLPVTGGMTDTVHLEAAAPQGVLTAVSEQGTLEIAPELPESVEAPVEKGQQVGVVRVSMNGETVEEIPVTAAESAEAITFGSAMRYLLEWFFLGAETQSGG
ncbi:D-alanyl-D-alanine carboxypeptidase family protein [Anaeromassilibacillus senegalensis]|uniref:serine-type D-Ala-D-Ala carboxypeptidase n=1 Tax=Anaeromassilibacillus senegalensis TaxID=1673717 RepID=A0ABS9CML0_9FIRM|nr:D-alanyl-D-alanine carboxypeptidase family protein [Anaeromassilibacillus senegalensis]MCF2651422.1 D-alanyl-D-alanine carboxypeptidase [Anaeromassilibacillus senegalensis]